MNILMEKHGEKIVLSLKQERIDAHNASELKDLFLKVLSRKTATILLLTSIRSSSSTVLDWGRYFRG